MLVESGLVLVFDSQKIKRGGGVFTPATCQVIVLLLILVVVVVVIVVDFGCCFYFLLIMITISFVFVIVVVVVEIFNKIIIITIKGRIAYGKTFSNWIYFSSGVK